MRLKEKRYVPKYIMIQGYNNDKWYDTKLTFKELEKQAKKFGHGLNKMFITGSDFHTDSYYYEDDCGHTHLYRGISEGQEEYLEEVEHLKKTGKPRCMTCKKDFIKIDEYTWKPNCKHNKNIRVSKG